MVVACWKVIFLKSFGETKNDHVKISLRIDVWSRFEPGTYWIKYNFPPPQCHRMFWWTRGFPPGCGDSVTDSWGWDDQEARLRCPDDVSGDMQEDEIPGGALSLNLLGIQTMVTTGIFPCKEKFPW